MSVSNSSQKFQFGLRLSALIVLMSLGLVALSSCTVTYRRPVPPPPKVVYVDRDPRPEAFADIDPYGEWVYIDDAGWAWSPDVRPDWRPYYHGNWVWSDDGWTWVSYEPFGWAVYHYGNWAMDSEWGWVWFPGYDWYPNRVTWVVYQDHIAWAPIPYRGYVIGDPWNVTFEFAWSVCNVRNFTRHYVGDYHEPGYCRRVHRNTRYVITRAPETKYIYQLTGVQVVKIHIKTQPVKGNKRGLRRITLPPREEEYVRKYRTRTEREISDKGHGRDRPTPITPAGNGRVAKPKNDRSGHGNHKDRERDDRPNFRSDHPSDRARDSRPTHPSDHRDVNKNKDTGRDAKGDDPKSDRGRQPDSKKDDPKSDRGKPDSKKDDPKSDRGKPDSKKDDPKSDKGKHDSKKDDSKSDKGKHDSKKDDSKSDKGKHDSKKDDAKSKKGDSKSKKKDKDSGDDESSSDDHSNGNKKDNDSKGKNGKKK